MQIVNISNGRVLAYDAHAANSFGKRLKGLLGQKFFERGDALVISPCQQIHSYGMKFKFDAIFVDKEMRVIHVLETIPPFKISPFIKKAYMVIELPAGTVASSGTVYNHQLIFQKGGARWN